VEAAQARAAMIAYLEGALKFAEEIKDGVTAYLIERALDEARGQQITNMPPAYEVN
jgi:hypothetical protein